MIRQVYRYKPTKERAAQIRAEIAARGVKARVRFFDTCYRVVIEHDTPENRKAVCDYAAGCGLMLAGARVANTEEALRFSWQSGQIFFYDYRSA